MLWYLGLLAVLAVLYLLMRRWVERRGPQPERAEQKGSYNILLGQEVRGLEFLEWLKSDDSELRTKGSIAALSTRLKTGDLPRIYQALREAYTSDALTDDLADAHEVLFKLLWRTHDRGTVDFIRELFPSLPHLPDVLVSALRVLGEMNTKRSLEALLDLLETHRPDLGTGGERIFQMQLREPLDRGQVAILFPRLFALSDVRSLKAPINRLAKEAREQGLLSEETLSSQREQLIQDCRDAIQRRATLERHSPGYKAAGDMICTALSAMGAMKPDTETIRVLKGILEMPGRLARLEEQKSDLRLKATLVLVRLGTELPGKLLGHFAADPRTRLELYYELESMARGELFPESYRSQEKLAESDMVRWLCSPWDEREAPEAIERLDTRVDTVEGETGRYHLFKFYYEQEGESSSALRGWFVGMSGPWPTDERDLSIPECFYTLSAFAELGEGDVDEHFAVLLESMPRRVDVPLRRSPYRDDE